MTLDIVYGSSGYHAFLVSFVPSKHPKYKGRYKMEKDLGCFRSIDEINIASKHVRHIEDGKVIKELGYGNGNTTKN